MELSAQTRRLIRLLAEGNAEEAKAAASSVRARIYEARAQLDAELAVIEEVLKSDIRPKSTAEETQRERVGGRPPRSTRVAQRHAVLTAAGDLEASTADGLITTDGIFESMARDGLDPPVRTAIGIILNHSNDWERIDRGLYRRRAPDDPVPPDDDYYGHASTYDDSPQDWGRQEVLSPDDLPF